MICCCKQSPESQMGSKSSATAKKKPYVQLQECRNQNQPKETGSNHKQATDKKATAKLSIQRYGRILQLAVHLNQGSNQFYLLPPATLKQAIKNLHTNRKKKSKQGGFLVFLTTTINGNKLKEFGSRVIVQNKNINKYNCNCISYFQVKCSLLFFMESC